jgi:hypothetical protein
MNLYVLIPILAVMLLLRVLRVRLLIWMFAWWLALYGGIRYGFATPVPHSVVTMYMAIVTLSLLAYMGSSRERSREVLVPITRFLSEKRFTLLLAAAAVLVPALVGYDVYSGMHVQPEPPYFARTVHPAPPPKITVGDTEVDLIRGDNPFRKLEKTDPEQFRAHVQKGRTVFYQNCFYCHGDDLAGDGMYARGLDPIPTNFTDAGVLPNFQETFFFWRIAKGGPGLPEEGGPWASAMPRWEQFLDEEQIWEVLLFLYDFTGRQPREVGEYVSK